MNGPAKIFMLAVWMLFAALGSLQAMDLEPIPAKELQLNSDGSISGTYQTLTEGDISIVHYLPSGAPSDGSFLVGDGSTYVKESGATARTSMGAAASGAIGSSGLTTGTDTILGRDTAGTGAIEQLTLGSGLALTSGVISVTGGSGGVGDVTGASSSTAQKAVVFSDTSGKALDEAAGAGNTFDPSTGAFTTTEGTAANPAIRMYGQAAGLYPYGSDGVGLSADGAPALEVDASGGAWRIPIGLAPLGDPFPGPGSFSAGTPTSPGGYDFTGYDFSGDNFGGIVYRIYAYRTVGATKYFSYSVDDYELIVDDVLGASTFDVPLSWSTSGVVGNADGYAIFREAELALLGDTELTTYTVMYVSGSSTSSVVDDNGDWVAFSGDVDAVARGVISFPGTAEPGGTLASVTPELVVGSPGTIAVTSQIPDVTSGTTVADVFSLNAGSSSSGSVGLSIDSVSQYGGNAAIEMTNYTTDVGTPNPYNAPCLPIIAYFKNSSAGTWTGGRITLRADNTTAGSESAKINFHVTQWDSGTSQYIQTIPLVLEPGDLSFKSGITNPDATLGVHQNRGHLGTTYIESGDVTLEMPDLDATVVATAWTSNPSTSGKLLLSDGTGTAAGIEASTAAISGAAYDATDWNGNGDLATKDAIRDKIESVVSSIPNLASPGAIGGTTPAAGTFTSLLASDPVAVTETRWIDFSAAAYAGAVETSVVVADASTGELQANGLAASVFFPIPTMPGSVLTRVRIKNAGITSGDGVTLTLLKRDESSTSTAFTTIGSPQTYNDEEVTVNVYDVPDETMVANTSYTAKVTLSGTIVSASIWSIGYEFSTMTY